MVSFVQTSLLLKVRLNIESTLDRIHFLKLGRKYSILCPNFAKIILHFWIKVRLFKMLEKEQGLDDHELIKAKSNWCN